MRGPLLGIAFKLLSTLCFTAMAATVKWLGDGAALPGRIPVGQVVFFRSFFALAPVLAWLAWRGDMGAAVRTRAIGGHVRRSMVGIGGMFCGFAGLMLLPLADATAISYAMPLVTVILAALILKERVRIYRWTAVVIGMLGVLIAMGPHLSVTTGAVGDVSALGALLALMGAIFAGFATIEVRKLTRTDATPAIVFYFSAFSSLAGALTFGLGLFDPRQAWVLPTSPELAALVLIGLFGGLGQITLTSAYRHAGASTVAPFEYVSMLWAVVAGYLLFSDVPEGSVLVGAAIVTASGLFVIYRERQLGLERAAEREAQPPRSV